MTQTLEPAQAVGARQRVEGWLADFEAALAARDADRAAALFATTSFWRDLDRVHLEPQDRRKPRRCEGPPPRHDGHRRRARLPRHRRAHRESTASSRRGSASRPPPAADAGTCGSPTKARSPSSRRCTSSRATRSRSARPGRRAPSTASTPSRVTWAEARQAEADGAGDDHPAVRRRHRRRAGRDRAGRPAAPARRAARRRRPLRPPRRPVARPVQVAVPARPGLVRPPALPGLPAHLAGLRAEGQDRRLARDVHEGHGGELLVVDDLQERLLQRRNPGVDGRPRPRRRGSRPQAEAARARDRHVGQAEHPDAAGTGSLPRRPAPQLAAPRAGRLPRQEGRHHRVQQLRVRHLRRAVGGRRRRHDGPAQLDAHREVGFADGPRAGRPLLGARARGRDDHAEGGPDLRLAPLPDHAHVPAAGVRRDQGPRPGVLRPSRSGRLPARLG